jgi:hypothetical protein
MLFSSGRQVISREIAIALNEWNALFTFQLAHCVQPCPPGEARFGEARSVFCLISFWSNKTLSH